MIRPDLNKKSILYKENIRKQKRNKIQKQIGSNCIYQFKVKNFFHQH